MRISKWVLSVLIVVVVNSKAMGASSTNAWELPRPTASAKPASFTFDQILAGVKEYYARLNAVDIEYTQATRNFRPDPQSVPLTKLHFAFKGEKRFLFQGIPSGKASDDGVQRALMMGFDGESARQYTPNSRAGAIIANKQPRMDQDGYLQALGIPLTDAERAAAPASPYLMPFALELSDLEWQVRPHVEVIDGAECHVIESKGKQRIWIDPQLGFAMRFRETYQALPDSVDKWPLHARYSFRDFTKLDVWLPKTVDIVAYNSARQPENAWNQVDLRTSHSVTNISINDDVQDSLFEIEFPVGTMVHDVVHTRVYRVGDANEELDLAVEKGKRVIKEASGRLRLWLIAVNVLIIIVIVAIMVRWRLRRSNVSR